MLNWKAPVKNKKRTDNLRCKGAQGDIEILLNAFSHSIVGFGEFKILISWFTLAVSRLFNQWFYFCEGDVRLFTNCYKHVISFVGFKTLGTLLNLDWLVRISNIQPIIFVSILINFDYILFWKFLTLNIQKYYLNSKQTLQDSHDYNRSISEKK